MAIIKVDKIVRLDEIDALKKSLESVSKKKEAQSNALTEQKLKLKATGEKQTEELGRLTITTHALKDAEKRVQSLELTREDLAKRLKESEVRAKDLVEKEADTEKLKSETEKKLTHAKKAEKEAKDKLSKIEGESGVDSKEYAAQKLVVEAAKIAILKHTASIESIDKDINVIEKQQVANDDIKRDIEDRLSQTEADIARNKDEVSAFKSKVDTHQKDYADVTKEVEEMRKDIESLEGDIESTVAEEKELQKELEKKESTRSNWNTSFEATALENYVEDLGPLSQEAKDQLDAKQKFNTEIADTLGIRGPEQNTKLDNTIGEIKETPELKDAVHTLSATAAKVMADMQNYTMASLVDKIKGAAMKGLVQIKLETTLTKGVINALFEAGYDVHFESEGNNYITIINWAHPNMTNPAKVGS